MYQTRMQIQVRLQLQFKKNNSSYVSGVGRPSLILDIEKVKFLKSVGFKMKDIAICFLIDRTALWRKLTQMNIVLRKFTEIDDNQ